MRIAVVGGGPGGLYFSILIRKVRPDWEVTVFERNAPTDAFGFGVVFSDETLTVFEHADPETYWSIAEQFGALAELRSQGLIRHLGLSTVDAEQLAEAQAIAPVVCVQNFYNIANRADAAVLAATAEQHIAYVPYFPLGGFSPLQSGILQDVAKRLETTPLSVAHLRENIAGAALTLPADAVAELDGI